jgi:hypothetical protein
MMVDIQILQTISIAIASGGVFLAAIYYIIQIRHQTRIRRTDLITRLVSTAGTKEYTEALFRVMALEFRDYDDFVKKYGSIPSLNPDQMAFRMICVFHEEVGMLLRRKLVEPDLIYDLFLVAPLWEKVKPIVEGLRKQLNEPRAYGWFEYLYNEMKKREQQLQQDGVKNG